MYLNRGLVKQVAGGPALKTLPLPQLRDDYILVKTVAVALNPADWQTLEEEPRPDSKDLLLGCDYSGIVVAVGKDVRKSFKKGQRIAGSAHGGKTVPLEHSRCVWIAADNQLGNDSNAEDGAFAEYIMVKGDVAMHIPPNISFVEAATLPCGLGTVALGFYKVLEMPLVPALTTSFSGNYILVYGGSSATGTLAIQFAKLYVHLFYFFCFRKQKAGSAVVIHTDLACRPSQPARRETLTWSEALVQTLSSIMLAVPYTSPQISAESY